MTLSLPATIALANFRQYPSIDTEAFDDIAVLQQAIVLGIYDKFSGFLDKIRISFIT